MINNVKYRVLGVMSGTSLDGIDLAICTFTKNKKWEFKIEKAETLKYSDKWKKTLENLHKRNKELIKQTDIEYGKFIYYFPAYNRIVPVYIDHLKWIKIFLLR